jgi:hypothetical protein
MTKDGKDDHARTGTDKISEVLKKMLTVGVGTLFLTEDALRKLVSEVRLPKELLGVILESASKTKHDFLESLSKEVLSQFRDKVDPEKLTSQFLEEHEVEIQMKLRFHPRAGKKNRETTES